MHTVCYELIITSNLYTNDFLWLGLSNKYEAYNSNHYAEQRKIRLHRKKEK